MTPRLESLTLRHIDPARLLFQRLDPEDPDVPSWFTEATSGGLSFSGWTNGSVLATMETKVQRKLYVAVVAVAALFATDEQVKAGIGSRDNVALEAASPEELEEFAGRAVGDIYPFLRAELYSLSARLGGIPGVMLQPNPVVGGPADPL